MTLMGDAESGLQISRNGKKKGKKKANTEHKSRVKLVVIELMMRASIRKEIQTSRDIGWAWKYHHVQGLHQEMALPG